MKKYIVEFIGTLFLILTIGCTVLAPTSSGVIAPLGIAAMLVAMVYAGGHVSGAHYNPAVTIAVALRGKCAWPDAIKYMIAQFAAAVAASALVLFLGFQGHGTGEAREFIPAFLAEFLFTFALAWVVLNVATAKGTSGNSFYGIAIGFVVLGGAFAVGGVSGGAFNPAVAIALGALKISATSDVVMYFMGEFLGAALAAYAFNYCNEKG